VGILLLTSPFETNVWVPTYVTASFFEMLLLDLDAVRRTGKPAAVFVNSVGLISVAVAIFSPSLGYPGCPRS